MNTKKANPNTEPSTIISSEIIDQKIVGLEAEKTALENQLSASNEHKDALEDEVAELKSKNQALEEEKAHLIADNAKQKALLTESEAFAKRLNEQNNKLESQKEAAFKEVKKLSQEVSTLKKAEGTTDVLISHNDETYKLIGKKFIIKGVEYSADQLRENEDLIDYLIEIQSGSLVKLTE